MFFVTPAYAEESSAHSEGGDAASQTHTETGVPHEAGHEGGFPPFNSEYYGSQILWLALTFGVFYLIISRVVAPRIGSILEDRQDRIARDLDEASRMKSEADDAIAAYEKELAAAKANAGEIAAQAREKAQAEADAERAASEAELSKKIAAAESRIAEITQSALAEVGVIAEETAASIVEELIGTKATKAEIASAVKGAGK
ncbi:F0F1 ATP synthase subunit B [Rhizobium sp. L1K21]|uniref:F0F1 ATP synthase subunit B n=1 Tax=Rhizobium sp. L1K21 TaxID=2954933 RepID=UPI002093921C|nr:F0F1 ATP synthase subunit B [Rhizobium sp. L1K21]MCO6186933.1 F0F1 ATP synthase subunit B [Rhizobium sp. L1K21]